MIEWVIGRAQHHSTSRGGDPHIAEMLNRATTLVNDYWKRHRPLGRHRERNRERSRDDDYGLEL